MTSPTNAALDPTMVRFARRVSHDLNNFSTVVRTYSELLLAELPAELPARADISEIQRAAEGMVAYLQRVTRFARASAMRRVRLPIDEAIADAVAEFRGIAPARTVAVPAVLDAAIEADPLWLRDVLGELLLNAHEAAPAGTPIALTVRIAEGRVALAVRDQGAGVQGDWAEMCEPFATTKNGVRGAGQGLALATSFALALGGTLTYHREGESTVVTLEVPAAK
ncbi:MAG: HAMP domain-containing histidine kinase [Gemmatimonadetes bacterium]|nr:HAMP domain-containing histidine kinase [Gemmatimonadota bacterium]